MLEPKRTESNVRPTKVEDLKNGYWFYNYDVKQVDDLPISDMLPIDIEKFTYIQVRIEGEPDYKKCVEHVIRAYITQSQEFDLINSYNKAVLNLLPDEEAKKAEIEYIDYLNKINEIKTKIKQDFE